MLRQNRCFPKIVLVLVLGLLAVKKSATSTTRRRLGAGRPNAIAGRGYVRSPRNRHRTIEHMQFEAAAAKAPAKIADPIMVLSVND